MSKISYLKRILKVYLTNTKSYLNFWHEDPKPSEDITPHNLGKYYMTFEDKAEYQGPRDKNGIILFDYHGDIGTQYNPVAIAQYGLAHYNIYSKTNEGYNFDEAKKHADWLIDNLEENNQGILVWKHDFDWHYKETLQKGWYSALSQGAGISLLVRMHEATGEEKYLKAAEDAFESLEIDTDEGGVRYVDNEGNTWLEEYIVSPPTHILNGFIWASWGVWDFYLATGKKRAKNLFEACIKTIKENLHRYDTGYWSLYDLSDQKMKMLASPFYHKLHIAQLNATYKLTDQEKFKEYEEKFKKYQNSWFNRKKALIYKAIFKLIYF